MRTYLLDANVFVYLRRSGRLALLKCFAGLRETKLATTIQVMTELELDPGVGDMRETAREAGVEELDFGLESPEGRSYLARRSERTVKGKSKGEDSCLAMVEQRPEVVLVTHDERAARKALQFGPDRAATVYDLLSRCLNEALLDAETARDVARDLAAAGYHGPQAFWNKLGPPA